MKWILKISLLLLIVFLIGILYSDTFDNWLHDRTYEWAVFAHFFVLIPILIFRTIRIWVTTKNSKIYGYLFSFGFILINVPIYTIWLSKHDEEIYKLNGVVTKAVVIKAYENHGKNIVYHFIVDGNKYTSFVEGNPANYNLHDSIEIIYNKSDPRMNTPYEFIVKRQTLK
jgi:hypothetical protein